MNNEFERAKREWDDEVGSEAARLVREGVPPFDAAQQARDNISQLRREKTRSDIRSRLFGKV